MENNTECVKVSYWTPDSPGWLLIIYGQTLDTHALARTHMHARRGGEGCNYIVHINNQVVFPVLAGEAT